jgi:hypothetical protein
MLEKNEFPQPQLAVHYFSARKKLTCRLHHLHTTSQHSSMAFLAKKNIKNFLLAVADQNTSHINLFRLASNLMTPMMMGVMVAIRSTWLLW